jgi:hypothetical protein
MSIPTSAIRRKAKVKISLMAMSKAYFLNKVLNFLEKKQLGTSFRSRANYKREKNSTNIA